MSIDREGLEMKIRLMLDDLLPTEWDLRRVLEITDPLCQRIEELEQFEFAEMLTHQECAAKKHPDWYIDSEHNILCPWCKIEELEAESEKRRQMLNASIESKRVLRQRVRELEAQVCEHDTRCCSRHNHHVMPHKGCILR